MTLVIQSYGAPPERHADRVVAQMLRELAQAHAFLWATTQHIIATSADGNPRAQKKMEARILRAGALATDLIPGKRGQYQLYIYDRLGWDAQRDEPILLGDPLPARPWIVCNLGKVASAGRGRERVTYSAHPMLFITHHALSRTAQRLGARTTAHLLDAATDIWNAAAALLAEKKTLANWLAAPEHGWRVPLGNAATVVLKRHENHKALIAATVMG